MKKIFTLCVMLLLAALPTQAENITAEEAQSLAQAFLSGQSGPNKVSGISSSQLKLTAQLSDCYLFSRGTNAGYVIVAGDDVVPTPILGYSDSGTLDADNLPCNLRWWLSQYEQEIAWAKENGITTTTSAPAKAPVVTKAAIDPLVQSHWNQSAPYYNLCPTQDGKTTYTGCVATATAQIMRYHKHPEKGTGSHSYTWDGTTLSQDFSQDTYDWDNMPLDYGSNYTTEQGNAVATLMRDIGYAVEMNYSTGGSGASCSKVATALPTYFGYSSSLKHLYRSDYGLTEWMEMLYEELVNERPVFYAGYNSKSGHAFVLDGYKQGYFHINWGWGGSSDGYFLVSTLDPDEQGIGGSSAGYPNDQEIIIGIEPSNGGEQTVTDSPIVTINSFTASSSSMSRSGSFSYYDTSTYFYNRGSSEVGIYVGLKIVDENENVTYLASSSQLNISAGYGTCSSSSKVSLRDFPTDQTQTYKVYPAFKNSADGEWYDVKVTGSGSKYLLATTDGTNINFTTPEATKVTLAVSNIEVPSRIYAGKTFTVTAKISATGGEYNSNIYAYSDGSPIGSAQVNVDEQNSATFGISCTAQSTAGTYPLTLKDKDGNVLADNLSHTIVDVPSGDFSISLSGSTTWITKNPSNLRIKQSFKCNGGYLSDKLYAWIFTSDGSASFGSMSTNVTIGSGETQTVEFEGSFNGTAGTTYEVVYYYLGIKDSKKTYIQIGYPEKFTASTAQTDFSNIGELIDGAYAQATKAVSKNNRPSLDKVQLNFDATENKATVVAVLQHNDTNEEDENSKDKSTSEVKAGYIFVVDQSQRGLMLMPPSDSDKAYNLTGLKVGDVITGTLAGYYKEKSGIPAFEVRKSVDNGSGSSKVTYTSAITTNTEGEATETEEATYPVTAIPNINFLAKTNEKDKDGNTNVGDVTKEAYGKFLNSIVTVSGTIREKNGQYYLLQNETNSVDDADLYRIYFTADEFPDINLADYIGTTGTFEGLLIKRNISEAKLSVMKASFFQISKFYLSELYNEMLVPNLFKNGAFKNKVDLYVHRTNLVTTGDNGYATICLPFDLTADEFKAAFGCEIAMLAKATSTTDATTGVQAFESVAEKNIEAGVPYLLKATGEQTDGHGSSILDATYWAHIGTKSITKGTPEKVESSLSNDIVNGEFYFCGTYGKKQYTTGEDGQPTTTLIADGGSEKYQYISTTDGTLRYLPSDSPLAFNGLRAYYYFPNWNATKNNEYESATSAKPSISIDGKAVTSIDGVEWQADSTAPVYSVSGQLVGHSRKGLPKGLYIQNGQKFAVK